MNVQQKENKFPKFSTKGFLSRESRDAKWTTHDVNIVTSVSKH